MRVRRCIVRSKIEVNHYVSKRGEHVDGDIITLYFEVVRGGLLRVTKEYSLTCVFETNEWFGDVIAYGQW